MRRRMVVRVAADHRDDGPWAIVAVEDAGVGFGETEAPRLFEAFYTTKPSTTTDPSATPSADSSSL